MTNESSVIVVNWNSGAFLGNCVRSIIAAAPHSEIVVVDNASRDASVESIRDFRNQVHIVRNSVNRGFAAAVNQGFAETSSPYVLILNPDVQVIAGSIELLVLRLADRRKAGAVGGYVNDKYLPRRLPTVATLVRENLGLGPSADRRLTGTVRVEQPAAAAFMVRRDAYDEIDGFDERFFPAWYEDVDFCRRLNDAGWEIYFEREAQFRHDGGYSAAVLGKKNFAEAYYHNQLRYAQKHFGAVGPFIVRTSIAAGMMLRIIAQPGNAAAFAGVLRGAMGAWRA
jgi:GT2 family glycosyltransferase